jgi:cytochrome bd-type quinol oxidase subunit 2
METNQNDNSLYQRYATKLLQLNGCAALGMVLFVLWCVAIHPREPGAESAIGMVLGVWCLFCLPVLTLVIAIASTRKGRLKERKTKLVQGFCLLLFIFWVLVLLACRQ